MVVQTAVQIYPETQTEISFLMQNDREIHFSDLSKYRGELMGFAIIIVAMFHVFMPSHYYLYPLRRLGNIGVDMFLFVSGIGLWFSWSKMRLGKKLDGNGAMTIKEALALFFKHRYLRIYPVWILVASIFYIWKYTTVPGGVYTPDIPNLIANILFNWSFWRADDLTFWYVPATMMMYIFAPPYMELIRKSPVYRWLPVAAILLAVMVHYVPMVHKSVGHLEIFFSRIPIFLIGINSGKWVMEKRTLEGNSIWLILLIFIMCLWICLRFEYIGHSRFPLFMERMVYIPMTFTGLLLECKILRLMPKYINRCLIFLGTISLEIYLVHIEFVIRPLGKLHLGYCMTTLLTLLISIPLAYILHWGIRKITESRFIFA